MDSAEKGAPYDFVSRSCITSVLPKSVEQSSNFFFFLLSQSASGNNGIEI